MSNYFQAVISNNHEFFVQMFTCGLKVNNKSYKSASITSYIIQVG